jgi:hypothetical protein
MQARDYIAHTGAGIVMGLCAGWFYSSSGTSSYFSAALGIALMFQDGHYEVRAFFLYILAFALSHQAVTLAFNQPPADYQAPSFQR